MWVRRALFALVLAVLPCGPGRAQAAPPVGQAAPARGTAIVAAGQPFEVGRPVVLWSDPRGFDGYQTRCIEQPSGGCCDMESKRYGARKGVEPRDIESLRRVISQLVLHFDGCVNSRSCFKSMHNRPRPAGSNGCGLSAHFMIDADGTIYQTLDLVERAYHAEEANPISIGVEICNRGRVDPGELHKLPAEYRTRPTRQVVINGGKYVAYDFRPEQYESIVALARTLLRVFPHIKPIIPEQQDGQPLLETLADPMKFAGILGHLHVDLQKQKWDPGALDWKRIVRALNGFELPVQIRSYTEIPRTKTELVAARRALFYNAEERASAFFPLAPGRLWHSGAHLRAARGSPVRAPTRGRVIAARKGPPGPSSTSFVLMRHELDVDETPIVFYSLLAHIDIPVGEGAVAVPWVEALAHGSPATAAALAAGKVVVLDERVEAGDPVGAVGSVSRGPEVGPEVHFEIFTTERLPGELGRSFRTINAADDGVIARRADIVAAIDANSDQQIDQGELWRFFRSGELDRRQGLRKLAIRHRHEWGDKTSAADLAGLRELAGLPASDRRAIYDAAFAPYVFWTDGLSRATGLPANQIVYSYHPLTFLLEIASRAAHVELPKARGREVSDRALEPRKLAYVPVREWTRPQSSAVEPPLFGPPVGVRLEARRREDIPLIELPSTDSK